MITGILGNLGLLGRGIARSVPGVGVDVASMGIGAAGRGAAGAVSWAAPKYGQYAQGYLGGLGRGWRAMGGEGSSALGFASGAGAYAQAGAGIGQVAGMGARAGVGAAGMGLRGVGWVGKKAWKHKVVTANVLGWGTAAAVGIGAQGGGLGSPIDMYTYSTGRNVEGTRLGSQLQAISEAAVYNTSSMAGMGAPMRFGSGMDTPVPITPWAQKAGGYSPAALGATGDLVTALHNLRRQ